LGSWVRILLEACGYIYAGLCCAALCRYRPCCGSISRPKGHDSEVNADSEQAIEPKPRNVQVNNHNSECNESPCLVNFVPCEVQASLWSTSASGTYRYLSGLRVVWNLKLYMKMFLVIFRIYNAWTSTYSEVYDSRNNREMSRNQPNVKENEMMLIPQCLYT